jgi:hypothetical protein
MLRNTFPLPYFPLFRRCIRLRPLQLLPESDHLSEKIDVVIGFAGHFFANLQQSFQKFWAAVHTIIVNGES